MTMDPFGRRGYIGRIAGRAVAAFVTYAETHRRDARVEWALDDYDVRGASPTIEAARDDAMAAWTRESGMLAA